MARTCHAEGVKAGAIMARLPRRIPLARRTAGCWRPFAFVNSACAHRKRFIMRGALAGVVVLMKLVGRTRGLADRGGRREGLVLRGLRAGTRNVSAGARALEWKRAASGRR